MKKAILNVSLCVSIFLAGCAGREANLVQVRQLGDEQKTCDELRSELYYIENEISRLLPKSDKTGRNIALGATGILFIVPLFFMDLKQGEKKEIEAYRQRYNHLLMISQQKGCKLPTAVAEETVERIASIKEQQESQADISAEIEQLTSCANCGEKIGSLEKSYKYESHTVCAKCYEKLKSAQ